MTSSLAKSSLAIAISLGTISVNGASADTSSADYIFLLDNPQQSCQQLGTEYQEITSFETVSFVVNICQQDDKYYYLGDAKAGNFESVFLPANSLADGKMYRASNGNISYIVTVLPNQAILSIERNGGQVAREFSLGDSCLVSQDPISEGLTGYTARTTTPAFGVYSHLNLNRVETTRDLSPRDNFLDVGGKFGSPVNLASCIH